jgi:RNA polymerase sigma factor (TIGR02999 family)
MAAEPPQPPTAATDASGGSSADLLPRVYDHLRALARAKLASESAAQSISPTALVHEAYLKMVGADKPWQDKRHFFAAAAVAMRRILVDRARTRQGPKRGVIDSRVSLEMAEAGAASDGPTPADLVASDWILLEAAMTALETHDPQLAEVVHLRYFAGLTVDETALAMGVSPRSVNRDWMVARAWLLRRIRDDSDAAS